MVASSVLSTTGNLLLDNEPSRPSDSFVAQWKIFVAQRKPYGKSAVEHRQKDC